MRRQRHAAAVLLLALAAGGAAVPAAAQDGGAALDGGSSAPLDPQTPADPLTPSDSAQESPADQLPADQLPGDVADPGAPPAEIGSGATAEGGQPVPPPYLVPGPTAEQLPVSAVAGLTEPPDRIPLLPAVALGSALAAGLLMLVAAALRSLGLRTPARRPAPLGPPGRLRRAGDAVAMRADDVRDFLRRSR